MRKASASVRPGDSRVAVCWLLPAIAIARQQSSAPAGARAPRFPTPPEITTATATGEAAAVLALERKIEEAVVKGDVAFAETVLSSDFHFRHGDGWTRG